ncbi:MAG: DUF1176 domain-containing protein [Micropepsaceae bacterium]
MRLLAALATATILAAPAHAEPKTFKDWIAGCDNTLACTAIGTTREDGEPVGYIRLTRAAGPDAAPAARVVVYAGETDGTLSITIDGKTFGKPLTAVSDGAYIRVDLDAAQSAAFIAAIANAKSVKLESTDKLVETATVSLDGSSAALRYIDAEQKRDGGVTALVAKGDKPASAVPAAPALPVVKAKPIKPVETALAPPAGLPEADTDMCGKASSEPVVYDLGDGDSLWGVCVAAGAYNYSYEFYLAGKNGKAANLPAGAEGGDTLSLTNPYLGEDRRTLESFGKGRGVGDCGIAESFAWDGKTLQRTAYTSMDTCRGVSSEDWIVTYRAKVE